jgi:NAD(P)-dependent dehydrogenase (short-subunit alcohol dehydrogenase family)
MKLFDITAKVAIVTGATRGLGRSIATGLSHAGATVVVVSRDQLACDAVAAELRSASGAETMGSACDIGDWDSPARLVAATVGRFGRIDILVNNAGTHPRRVSVCDMTPDFWDELQHVNVRGPVRLAGLVAPHMAAQGGGSIVNIASMTAYLNNPNVAAYSASKAGLIAATRTMAMEWGHLNVRVNAISPGPFVTDMTAAADRQEPGLLARVAAGIPAKRVADPDELVGAVIYLASAASSFVTGEDHLVSGGMQR